MLEQHSQDAHKRHGCGNLALTGAVQYRLERRQFRYVELDDARRALRQEATQLGTALEHVAHLVAVLRRLAKRQLGNVLIAHRNVEAIAQFAQRLIAELFLLVGHHLPFGRLAEPEALDRLGQDYGGPPACLHRRGVGRVHLAGIMAAAVETPDVFVRHVGDHFLKARILAEEMLARIGAALGLEILILAIDALLHDFAQQALVVTRQQPIPARSPDYLDHVPAGAEKRGLQFLDDLAIAAHRPVEALQIAVDDEHQVVELLAHRHRYRAHGFGLVHLPVTAKRPYLAIRSRHQAAMLEIAYEARLIDRHHRPQAHRHGRKLPEIRHQPGVRIGAQAAAVDFLPEPTQLILA